MKIRQNTFLVSLLWTLLIASSFAWNYTQAKREQERLALHTARNLFNHIIFTCHWNARYGGVYVPVSKTPAGETSLPLPKETIRVNASLSLTKIDPALMTKQIAEIAQEKNIRYDIISSRPINSMTKATEEEEIVLHKFETGLEEEGKFITTAENTSFSYIAPLKVKPSCVQCHNKQKYKEGDIMGGIRIVMPYARHSFFDPLLFAHIGITLMGLLGILVAGIRLSRAYAIIQRQAIFDALTGIPNRLNFAEHIVKEYSRSSRTKESLAVIMCDIDHFKAFNDTYGHNSGDKCLQKVAQTIKNSLVRPGDFCARYGGEEFVVILADTTYKGAIHVAERIRFNIIKLQIDHEKSLPLQLVTLSLGIATTGDQPLNSYEDLLKNADTALYEAKRKGRNRVESYSDIPSIPAA
ncbi:MAG: diguanylate cyclase [Desulfobulbaceae bacterium]|nr:diguanylate cyclase [Desulfobulbaceae bacterium]